MDTIARTSGASFLLLPRHRIAPGREQIAADWLETRLTPKQLADALGMSEPTLHRRYRDKLTAYRDMRDNRAIYFKLHEVVDALFRVGADA